jgi:hypothetical protein
MSTLQAFSHAMYNEVNYHSFFRELSSPIVWSVLPALYPVDTMMDTHCRQIPKNAGLSNMSLSLKIAMQLLKVTKIRNEIEYEHKIL